MESGASFELYFFLYAYIFIVFLQALSMMGNGLITFLFIRSEELRKNTSLRLLFLLALTDGLFAICALPYTLNYIINWNPVELNYEQLLVLGTGLPLLVQFKINLVITLAITLDRYQAICYPVYYLEKNHVLNSILTLLLGILFAILDIVLEFLLSNVEPEPGCGTIGCFTSPNFNAHWSASNMLISTIGIVLSLMVVYEARKRSKTKLYDNDPISDPFQESNHLSSCLMISGFSFMLFPSALIGIGEIGGLELLKKVDIFYILCLLMAGVTNSVIYTTQNVEVKNSAKEFFCRKHIDRRLSTTPIVPLNGYNCA